MVKKAPRRTAQRILDSTLELFNRYGEPNVSTTRIAAELNISPGNLYYHYPAKDALINRLHQDYEVELQQTLTGADTVSELPHFASLMRALMALVWRYRFLYRDLNDLLSKSRTVETRQQTLLRAQEGTLRVLLRRLTSAGHLQLAEEDAGMLARNIVVLLSFWLSYEYASDPREALEPEHATVAIDRGTSHILRLLTPYMPQGERESSLPLPRMQPSSDPALTH